MISVLDETLAGQEFATLAISGGKSPTVLFDRLAATRFPMSCPHGRPIALRYSTRDILRGFHRI